MQQVVYDKLPTYSAELFQAGERLRSISRDEQKKALTPIVSIYLGPAEGRQSFREKSGMYSRELIELVGFGDEDIREFLSVALGAVFEEQYERVHQNLQAFERVVLSRGVDTFGDESAARDPTESTVREMMERQGLIFDDIDRLSDSVFVEGFVDLERVGGLSGNGSGILPTKDWRARLHLERRTVASLHHSTKLVADVLGHALDNDDLSAALDSRDDDVRRRAIGMLMGLVRDAGTGKKQLSTDMEGREELLRRARGVLELVEVNPEARAATFARILRTDRSLPLRTHGLMNTSLGDMLAKSRNWFVVQREHYRLKADGLERILGNKSVPEDFRRVTMTQPADKQWFFPSSINASEEFGYIPLGYLP